MIVPWNCQIWRSYYLSIYIILLGSPHPWALACPKAPLIGRFWGGLAHPPNPWPTPSEWPYSVPSRIVHDRPPLDFSLAFFRHINVTNWHECSYITLPTLFSFFRRIIDAPGLLSYRTIIPFVRWRHFNANLHHATAMTPRECLLQRPDQKCLFVCLILAHL